jgi:FkbM family methyltransferase
LRSSSRKLKPLPPDPFRHQDSVIARQTLLAVKASDLSRRYVGVEPNPICVAYVEKLISANHPSDCRIASVGLGIATGIRKLQLYHGDTVDSEGSLVEGFRPEQVVTNVKLVPVFPYSDIEHALASTDLSVVKIDVEGGEADVLASMRFALVAFRPWIIMEILPMMCATLSECRGSRPSRICFVRSSIESLGS